MHDSDPIPGDSCDCPYCRERRAHHGASPASDALKHDLSNPIHQRYAKQLASFINLLTTLAAHPPTKPFPLSKSGESPADARSTIRELAVVMILERGRISSDQLSSTFALLDSIMPHSSNYINACIQVAQAHVFDQLFGNRTPRELLALFIQCLDTIHINSFHPFSTLPPEALSIYATAKQLAETTLSSLPE